MSDQATVAMDSGGPAENRYPPNDEGAKTMMADQTPDPGPAKTVMAGESDVDLSAPTMIGMSHQPVAPPPYTPQPFAPFRPTTPPQAQATPPEGIAAPSFQPASPPPQAVPPVSPAPPAPAVPAAAGPQGATVIIGASKEEPEVLAWLAVFDGPGAPKGQLYTMQREMVVGRSTGQIVLSGDQTISSQHAKIRLEKKKSGEAVYVLYDMASANGTYAGDREHYQDESNRVYRHELKDGDFVLFGETTLVFKCV